MNYKEKVIKSVLNRYWISEDEIYQIVAVKQFMNGRPPHHIYYLDVQCKMVFPEKKEYCILKRINKYTKKYKDLTLALLDL